jgi:hypothetical protein
MMVMMVMVVMMVVMVMVVMLVIVVKGSIMEMVVMVGHHGRVQGWWMMI